MDLAVAAWAPLAGGVLTGKYSGSAEKDQAVTKRLFMNGRFMTEGNFAIAQVVQQVAEQIGRRPSQVALNWLRHRDAVVIPIVGARTLDQLNENLGCLDFDLDAEHLAKLDEVSRIQLGYPHDFVNLERIKKQIFGDVGPLIDNHHRN
jgi:aryl-alcohol dehydrogenase-like predicted oxidoreductase